MKTIFDLTIDFEKSQDSYFYDKNSDLKYLDFFSMYSSLPLGYNHKVFDDSFKDKISKVSYIKMSNNVCHSDEIHDFIENFTKYTFSRNIHFSCTGALAIESAIKTAMHYKKVNNPLVLSVKKSFHGVNGWGFTTDRVGVTAKRMEYFPSNNWLQLEMDEIIYYLKTKKLDNLTAIIIEPIQCTNGDIYLDKSKLKEIRELCEQKNVCFIIDEIQTGFGTTGKMWYYEYLEIIPDILVFGKKTQVSGIVINEKYNEISKNKYQKLDVTFNGDLIDIIRAQYIMKAYKKYDLLNQVNKNSIYLKEKLSNRFLNYRSMGHLIAFDFETLSLRDEFVKRCYEKKLLINKACEKSVRLRPNLAINKKEIEHFINILNEVT